MTAIKTPKDCNEFVKWYEQNQDNCTKDEVFIYALDLITTLEADLDREKRSHELKYPERVVT